MHDVEHRDWSASLAAAKAAGGARLIVTSPPYPDARTVEQYGGAEFDTSLAGYGRLGEACYEALVPGGVVALNIDGPIRVWRKSWDVAQSDSSVLKRHDREHSERSLIAFKVAIDWAERIGFQYIEHCAYIRESTPGRFGTRWRSGWEPVHVFARPGSDVCFDHRGCTVAAKTAGEVSVKTKYTSFAQSVGGSPRVYEQPENRCLTTAVAAPAAKTSGHSAAFARELADAFVLCYSQPDDIVCDPFVGSGTVAFSCHRHGRRFVGGDLGHRERDGRRWADIVRDGLRQTTLFEGLQ